MEPVVTFQCRLEDVALVEKVLIEAQDIYKQTFKKEVQINLSKEYLPKDR
jgi:hypothetical protein